MLLFTPALPVDIDQDDFAQLRARDRLLLFRDGEPGGALATQMGLAVFTAFTILAAHADGPLRTIFAGPVHVGPALFEGGAMGAAVGGVL